jgi:bis(5'-nucleosyl)-tetraphosphatase (symmetrical)
MNTMALYLIGDVQGCDSALHRLLNKISFSASRDTLYLLGDLVNRGPDSAGVLRRLMGYGASAQCVLGNHDLHLLALAYGARKPGRKDTLDGILNAPDRQAMLDWLRGQPMAMLEQFNGQEILMVHAGVLPAWTAAQTMALASEVENVLRSAQVGEFLQQMYGDEPTAWQSSLTGPSRLRVIVNALTRLRFCSAAGHMEFTTKEGFAAAPPGYLPWFDLPGRKTANVTVAFGHWSTLGWLNRADLISLDTGCVWGGCLSALRLGNAGGSANPDDSATPIGQLIRVKCKQAQIPG